MRDVEGKGRGLFTTQPILAGDFVCEYKGKLISAEDVGLSKGQRKKWPPVLEDWTSEGCFSYFFRTLDLRVWCMDAMHSSGPGRLINHDPAFNLKTRVIEQKGSPPRLFFQATKDIPRGMELTYDYGEQDEDVIAVNPWLRSNNKKNSN